MSVLSKQETITYDSKSFIVNGRRVLLVGGEFHYFRTPCELWEDRIVKMKRCGANLVTTYIPWNWHEQTEGQQCWEGDKDLVRFMEICKKHEMYLIVKPGPYICAEWDLGGHPDWLLCKKIPLRVLNEEYLGYVGGWYKSVAEKIKPHLVTNGGNILCIQVENEYDHLMDYGEDKISFESAIEYFERLSSMLKEFGIDIPQFANEAEFLRGKGIIDTRTYYPNIPFFTHWMYEHAYFDGKIIDAKKGQPDCPTMILELQVGWFSQFGQPFYVPDVNLTESVSKSVLILGASTLNYYMFAGGTTFPYWGCRGNNWGIQGIGTGTSFDFGGAMIREWGELMPGRYDWTKALLLFCKDYKDLILESDSTDDFSALSRENETMIVDKDQARVDKTLSGKSEKFKVYAKKSQLDEYLVCVRNLSSEKRVVDLIKNDETVFEGIELQPRETFLLPFNVCVPNTEIKIIRSSSELLFAKEVDDMAFFGLYGKTDRAGQTTLNVPPSEVEVLRGDIEVGGSEHAVLKYKHKGIQTVKVNGHLLFIISQDMAGKIEEIDNGILIADTYFVKDVERNNNKTVMQTESRIGFENKFYYFGKDRPSKVTAAGKDLEINVEPESFCSSFEYKTSSYKNVQLKWDGNWKVKSDIEEAVVGYDDNSWFRVKKPMSLEEAGFLKHGYIWYRSQFELPKTASDLQLVYNGNATDRQYIYVNGHLVFAGITEADKQQKIEVDDDIVQPGKNFIAVLYCNTFHNKSHPHEGAILKYSGIMQDIVVNVQTERGLYTTEVSQFKVRQDISGIEKGYTEFDHDDSEWMDVSASRKYVTGENMGEVVWFRRKFTYNCDPKTKTAVKLTIPDANQRCVFYLNGRPLGQFESVGPQHEFYIPEPFLANENVLSIVLEGTDGYLVEPELDTFYESFDTEIKLYFDE
jgi:Glycosyl hydrolases family 35/Beta-galactosidase second all-beta domain